MKKIVSIILSATLVTCMHADTADLLNNIAVLAKGIPVGKEKQARKDNVVNLLEGTARISYSVEKFVNTLNTTKDSANLTFKRVQCIGKSSPACTAVGCKNDQACIQKSLAAINQFLKPLINTLIGEKVTDGIKPGALLSLLTLLPKDSERRKTFTDKLTSYVLQLTDILDFLNSLGFIINPASLSEPSDETAKMSEALKKSLAEEVVKIEAPKEEIGLPEGVDLSDFA